MRGYWLKIGFGAVLIFAVGFGVLTAGRKVKGSIESNRDLTIPLGSFVTFNLEGTAAGTIRSLTLKRSEPHALSGFDLHLRVTDTATFTRLQACHLSVTDVHRIDERTSFVCLPSDSGFQSFGEVTVDLRTDSDDRTLVLPLLLPPGAIQGFQKGGGAPEAGGGLADSIAAVVKSRAVVQARLYRDSVKAVELDRAANRMKERADSLRALSKPPEPAPPEGAKPPSPISP